jgi:negative regulator of flagellin synthesis FlgM
MKIDDRILNYEIPKHLPKSSGSSTAKVDEIDSSVQEKGDSEKASQQDVIVNFSKTSKEVHLAKEVIASQPDVREEKVAEIKDKIQSRTYKINHGAVASKLVDDMLKDI